MKNKVLFVRTGGLETARYGIKGAVECKLIEPIGIEYCVAFLRNQGVNADIYDLALWPNEQMVINEIVSQEPLIVGFSILYSHMMYDSYDLIEKLRTRGFDRHITIGGTYPTLSAHEVLSKFPLIDSVCRVEGEHTIYDLFMALEGGSDLSKIKGLVYREKGEIIENEPRPLIGHLDEIPNPDRDRFKDYQKMGGIIQIHSSRGCHANCSFCGTAAFYRCAPGPKWRARSPKSIVNELRNLLLQSTTNEVWFTDDNFIGPGALGDERVLTIAKEIISHHLEVKFVVQSRSDNFKISTIRKLKEAGLRKMYIGVESGTKRHLQTYTKKTSPAQNRLALKLLEKEGIFAELGFIGFDPYTTFEEFKINVDFIRDLCINSRFIHLFAFDMLIPYRGTPIANILLNDDLAVEDDLDFRSVIKDPVIAKAWACVDYLLIQQGKATEFIKSLIIGEQAQKQAQDAILLKNQTMVEGLEYICSVLESRPVTDPIEIEARLSEMINDLNRRLGI